LSSLIPFLSLFAFLLFVPSLIVIIWKRRPVRAFLLGAIIAFLTPLGIGVTRTYNEMVTSGAGDPQMIAGEIAGDILAAIFWLTILLPTLALIQWIARRRFKKKQALSDKATKDVFS
jgi:hypothetical protein